MNEDFVTFELAKKLQEKGFDWQTFDWYDYLGNFNKGMMHRTLQGCPMRREYYAPTIGLALKWLREEKGVYVNASTFANHKKGGYFWGCEVCDISEMPIIVRYKHSIFEKGNYKEAILTGIEYCLDNLI